MGKLADFTIEELMIFTATILASLGVCMKICFTSRCRRINLLYGLISCERDVLQEKEKDNNKNKNQSSLSEPEPEEDPEDPEEPLFN